MSGMICYLCWSVVFMTICPLHVRAGRGGLYTVDLLHNHKTCLTGSLFVHTGITSIIQCMALCSSESSCKGVFYTTYTKQCRGCHTLNNLQLYLGGVFYRNEADALKADCINHDADNTDTHTIAARNALSLDPNFCVRNILVVTNGGHLGTWYDATFCPEGLLAVGFNIRIESNQGPLDDSAANALKLICNTADQTIDAGDNGITSNPSSIGSWEAQINCDPNRVLKAFRMQVEEFHDIPLIPDDNSMVNYVRFKCGPLTPGQLTSVGGAGPFGDFGSWSMTCKDGHGICGMRARFDASTGMGVDNTGINDMVFYCC